MYLTLANGIRVFYREAGSPTAPTILLLHGFPSSSFQYRNLIPLLASAGYHVLAPDLPGFGFTEVPATLHFAYTFANFAHTVGAFLDHPTIAVKSFAMYIFDYGAPTGLRLALERPGAVTAIVSQNGNAYADGLGAAFWAPLQHYWTLAVGSPEYTALREKIQPAALTLAQFERQYTLGTPAARVASIDPATYHLDWALLGGSAATAALPLADHQLATQLDIFYDYGTNVALYPQFHAYFRSSRVPLLAIWGANDEIFVPAGAEAFKRDLPDARVKLLDAGHFAVETHTKEIGDEMVRFLAESGVPGEAGL